ncbi:Map microtubule affinity-regulating kinase [Globomyces sp. JEL0801]|nr:Map microtubule affinity-regulating kinase [Globomyces sp. JEL0801]
MLQINPKKRLTMAQILEHPWLNTTSLFIEPIASDAFVHKGFRPKLENQMDATVLDQMEHMGHERKVVIQSVLNGKFNQLAGIYFILTYQKIYSPEEYKTTNAILAQAQTDVSVVPTVAVANSEGPPFKSGEISEELARVLFQVERTRTPLIPSSPASRKKSGRPFHESLKNPRRSGRQLDPVGMQNLPKIDKTKLLANSSAPHTAITLPIVPDSIRNSLVSRESTTTPIRQKSIIKPIPTTKFGIPKSNQKTIPIDETLYIPSTNDSTVRTIKFAFNLTSPTTLSPDALFEKLCTILENNDIQWYHDNYLCECQWGDIKFEMEVCQLPRMESYGIRLKRLVGDIWEFKKLSAKITTELE